MKTLLLFLTTLTMLSCQKPLFVEAGNGDAEAQSLRHLYARNHVQPFVLPGSLAVSETEPLRGLPWERIFTYRDKMLFATHNGFLYSSGGYDDFNDIELSEGITSMVAPLGDTLFISSARGKNGLTAYNARGGKVAWEKRGLFSESAPVAYEGRVIHATLDGRVIAYNSRGAQLWENRLEQPVRADLAAQDGFLVVATTGGQLRCYDARKGTLAWSLQTGTAMLASPLIYGERVFAAGYDGILRAYDLKSGEKYWQKKLGSPVYYGPCAQNDTLFIGLPNRAFYALNAADGARIWQATLDGPPTAPPLLLKNEVLVGTAQRSLFRMKRQDGTFIQKIELQSKPRSTAHVYKGKLYISLEPDIIAVLEETE